jgi:hypothetical protein
MPLAVAEFQLFLIVLSVSLGKPLPFLRQVFERKDGGNRTNWYAGPAIDALDWVDVKHGNFREIGFILTRVDTIHRADVHARGVLGIDAWFSNHIGHPRSLLRAFLFAYPCAPVSV